MKPTRLSLKWLDVFLHVARTGSIRAASEDTGLSISTVSHHLRQLETALGPPLFDHARRPMPVTPAGAVFQRRIDEALRLIRKAEAEAQAGSLQETRHLSIALVEDFDSEIGSELARILTASMPQCRFRHLTRPSHEILDLLRGQEIDMGIAARPQFDAPDLTEMPLLRDPFVLALPASAHHAVEDVFAGRTALPLLRYARNQIMAKQIEQQLRRLRVSLPDQFEFDSNQTIMRLVAEGDGWAITTPANYMRANRFHRQIRLAPFPGKGFARYISVFTTELANETVARTVTETMRHLIQTRAIEPAIDGLPWLADQFRLLTEDAPESDAKS